MSKSFTPMCVVKDHNNVQYLVIGEATHVSTGSVVVVYRPMKGDRELFVVNQEDFDFEYVGMLVDILDGKKD